MDLIKLAKNPEARRLLSAYAIIFILSLALALLFSFAGLRYFQNTAHINYTAIVGAITEKYPEAEQDMIRQILHADEVAASRGRAVLSRYGLDMDELLPAADLPQHNFRVTLVMYLSLAVLACGALTLFMVRFLHKQYAQINEVTAYARQIKNGDYSLDIRDNNEGDVSLLKNEIYKITTMLREQSEALQREKTALADSIADISHQLKTPMTSMFVLTDLLDVEPSAEVKANFLDRMKAQLSRIDWLVTSLLKLSRFDAGAVTMKDEEVSVRELIDKTLESVSIPLDIKMQQVSIRGETGTKFRGDMNWTVEALINILKNCIEHTPEKGSIEITYAENPVYTLISVADSGSGIDLEDLPYIFNRFYKGKNAGDDSVGIGLAMSGAIVSSQGGDITVKSEPGRGSEFTIKFYKT